MQFSIIYCFVCNVAAEEQPLPRLESWLCLIPGTEAILGWVFSIKGVFVQNVLLIF